MACKKTTVYSTVEPRLSNRCCTHCSLRIITKFIVSRKQEKALSPGGDSVEALLLLKALFAPTNF